MIIYTFINTCIPYHTKPYKYIRYYNTYYKLPQFFFCLSSNNFVRVFFHCRFFYSFWVKYINMFYTITNTYINNTFIIIIVIHSIYFCWFLFLIFEPEKKISEAQLIVIFIEFFSVHFPALNNKLDPHIFPPIKRKITPLLGTPHYTILFYCWLCSFTIFLPVFVLVHITIWYDSSIKIGIVLYHVVV